MKNFMIELIAVIGGIAINLAVGAFTSVILLSYWGWFIVPLGVRDINFFHAWGLLLIPTVLFLTSNASSETEFDPEKALLIYAKLFFGGLILWAFGFFLSTLIA